MCPGGQVVCTSVEEDELCVNGMSFSKRQSKWANSALVASVDPRESFLGEYMEEAKRSAHGHEALGGVLFQRAMEREAAIRGGGAFKCPVQRVTDFLDKKSSVASVDFPTSSYRLGVTPASLHDIYPDALSAAIATALEEFDRRLPGFLTPEALLHGVETRTSSAVRISRDPGSLQCEGVSGLFPCGEGAGYAGGIVSSAVDGVRVAAAVLGASMPS
ncbi:hypothetical protein T484DRAFT_1935370 [Baffinella frigidus]|nr:hypothetical protein T484DRAFT_1935370 [Cryptophyta sp. CCMP2293]